MMTKKLTLLVILFCFSLSFAGRGKDGGWPNSLVTLKQAKDQITNDIKKLQSDDIGPEEIEAALQLVKNNILIPSYEVLEKELANSSFDDLAQSSDRYALSISMEKKEVVSYLDLLSYKKDIKVQPNKNFFNNFYFEYPSDRAFNRLMENLTYNVLKYNNFSNYEKFYQGLAKIHMVKQESTFRPSSEVITENKSLLIEAKNRLEYLIQRKIPSQIEESAFQIFKQIRQEHNFINSSFSSEILFAQLSFISNLENVGDQVQGRSYQVDYKLNNPRHFTYNHAKMTINPTMRYYLTPLPGNWENKVKIVSIRILHELSHVYSVEEDLSTQFASEFYSYLESEE